jgi:PncC family amidohydrolase
MTAVVEERLGQRLAAASATVAVAESCTGGLIAHRLTNVPGSSVYFMGGVVAYADAAKSALLGVPAAIIEEHGAVSESVARRMAEGVRGRFNAVFGVGTTGIAGPGGGTMDKPVGLVYIALAGPRETVVHRMLFEGDRAQIKSLTAEAALHFLEEVIE